MVKLYHKVPKNMTGRILYPLNTLKKIYPEIYKSHIKKYFNRRKFLPKEKIPILDCLWNDVLHLTPVHPAKINNALRAAGARIKGDGRFFEIDPKKLDASRVLIYKYPPPTDELTKDSLETFSPAKLRKYTKLRSAVKTYYKKMVAAGERPLRYRFVPHVFYKGEIDISRAKIITI